MPTPASITGWSVTKMRSGISKGTAMELGATRVEVFADGRVTVGGEAISPPEGIDPYSAAIAVLADYAKSSGAPVLADAVDHVKGQEGRFHVHPDGRAEAVTGFPGAVDSTAGSTRRKPLQTRWWLLRQPQATVRRTLRHSSSGRTGHVPPRASAAPCIRLRVVS